MKKLQEILKDVHAVLGLNISLYDIEGTLITAYPMKNSPFCELIKSNPKSRNICKKCDLEAFERVKISKSIEIYRCQFNLYDACVPVFYYEELTGFLMMGQMSSDSLLELEKTHDLARPFIKNGEQLEEALKKIPIKTETDILSFSTILDMCANYISKMKMVETKSNKLAIGVKNFISNHYEQNITIDNLCRLFFCSKSTLTNQFKAEYNQSIHSYILECRMNKACELLQNEELSISQISSLCGFNDICYFSKSFKKERGISPKQYRIMKTNLNREYSLVAFDMDGTLLQSDKTISAPVAEAINKAIEQGKEVAISTGRCLPELYEVFNKTPNVRYLIVTNGALIYDKKDNKELSYSPIPVKTVWKILSITQNRDVAVHFLDYECVLEKDKVHIIDKYGMGAYQHMYYQIGLLVDDICEYYRNHEKPIQKINLYHRNNSERDITIKLLRSLNLTLTYADSSTIECVVPQTSKGTALKSLCNHLNINRNEVIAVGDGFNDISILREAGLAISMGNAVEEVKKLSDIIVSDNDHDGCKEIIDNYLLK